MKRVLTILLAAIAMPVLATSDSTVVKRKDTLSTISITPYLVRNTNGLTHYFVPVSSPTLLKFSSGINIFNSLRGLYPGLYLPTYAPDAIDQQQTMLLDGIALNGDFNNNVSLNSFDYESIVATRSGNALTILDEASQNGAFILTSKSGKDVSKPIIEFNSFNTYGLGKSWPNNYGLSPIVRVNNFDLSQSLAFSQDFGKVDIRTSYNFLTNHNSFTRDSFISYPDPKLNRLKINAGVDITPKLNVRLITDGTFLKHHTSDQIYSAQGMDTIHTRSYRKFYQTNLSVHYDVLSSLSINGQVYYGRAQESSSAFYQYGNYSDNNRNSTCKLFNPVISINFNKNLGQAISLVSTIGVNFRKSNKEVSRYANSNGSSDYESNIDSQSFFFNSLIGYKERVFVEGSWRSSSYSIYPPEVEVKDNYSFSVSGFVLKKSTTRIVSSLKLRSSIGGSYHDSQYQFPYEFATSSYSPGLKKREVGLDLSFLQSKLSFSANLFNSIPAIWVSRPVSISTGFSQTIGSPEAVEYQGYETILDFNLMKGNHFQYTIRALWSKYESNAQSVGLEYSYPSIYWNSYYDWAGSVWSMLTWNNLSALLIVEKSHGGDLYKFGTSGNSYEIIDASWTKLRDISIGYTLTTGFIKKLKINECFLSLSGRNLLSSIPREDDIEVLHDYRFDMQKSITLNLGLVF